MSPCLLAGERHEELRYTHRDLHSPTSVVRAGQGADLHEVRTLQVLPQASTVSDGYVEGAAVSRSLWKPICRATGQFCWVLVRREAVCHHLLKTWQLPRASLPTLKLITCAYRFAGGLRTLVTNPCIQSGFSTDVWEALRIPKPSLKRRLFQPGRWKYWRRNGFRRGTERLTVLQSHICYDVCSCWLIHFSTF